MSREYKPVLHFDKAEGRVVYDRDVPISMGVVRDICAVKAHVLSVQRSDLLDLIERLRALLDGKASDEHIRECFSLPFPVDENMLLRFHSDTVYSLEKAASELTAWLALLRMQAEFDDINGRELMVHPLFRQFVRLFANAPGTPSVLKHEHPESVVLTPDVEKMAKGGDE